MKPDTINYLLQSIKETSYCEKKEETPPLNLEQIGLIVADDDAFSNLAIRAMVEQTGHYKIFACFTGTDALKCYKENCAEISAAILDIEMPGLTGVEVAREIRKEEEVNKRPRLPLIGLTGHENEEIRKTCTNAGMDVVLAKPITKEKINDVLSKLIH